MNMWRESSQLWVERASWAVPGRGYWHSGNGVLDESICWFVGFAFSYCRDTHVYTTIDDARNTVLLPSQSVRSVQTPMEPEEPTAKQQGRAWKRQTIRDERRSRS